MKKTNNSTEVVELLNILEQDIQTASKTRQQINRLENHEFREEKEEDELPQEDEEKIDYDLEFEEEVSFYLERYLELESDFTTQEFIETLPSRQHYRVLDILMRLELETQKEMNALEEIIVQTKDVEEKEEFRKLWEIEKKKRDLLRENRKEEKKTEDIQPIRNKIILVPTSAGNIRVLDELEHIPQEYYSRFLELIKSIEDGTFKRVKRFTNHHDLLGMNEVKAHATRVVFARIGKDSYAVLTAFLKKSDNDKLYKETLISKIQDYRRIESTIKELIQDEDFQEENRESCQKLFQLLGEEREKEGEVVYEYRKN